MTSKDTIKEAITLIEEVMKLIIQLPIQYKKNTKIQPKQKSKEKKEKMEYKNIELDREDEIKTFMENWNVDKETAQRWRSLFEKDDVFWYEKASYLYSVKKDYGIKFSIIKDWFKTVKDDEQMRECLMLYKSKSKPKDISQTLGLDSELEPILSDDDLPTRENIVSIIDGDPIEEEKTIKKTSLIEIKGLGPKTAEKLRSLNISSVEELVKETPQELANNIDGASAESFKDWINQGKDMDLHHLPSAESIETNEAIYILPQQRGKRGQAKRDLKFFLEFVNLFLEYGEKFSYTIIGDRVEIIYPLTYRNDQKIRKSIPIILEQIWNNKISITKQNLKDAFDMVGSNNIKKAKRDQILNFWDIFSKSEREYGKGTVRKLNGGKFLSKTFIVKTKKKESKKISENQISDVDLMSALLKVKPDLEKKYGIQIVFDDLDLIKGEYTPPDDVVKEEILRKEKGWLLEYDQDEWVEKLKKSYNRHFYDIVSNYQKNELTFAIMIDDLLGKGKDKAIFYWAINEDILVAEFKTPYYEINRKLKSLWKDLSQERKKEILNRNKISTNYLLWYQTPKDFRKNIIKEALEIKEKEGSLDTNNLREILSSYRDPKFVKKLKGGRIISHIFSINEEKDD